MYQLCPCAACERDRRSGYCCEFLMNQHVSPYVTFNYIRNKDGSTVHPERKIVPRARPHLATAHSGVTLAGDVA